MENSESGEEITPLYIEGFRKQLLEENFEMLINLSDFVAEQFQKALFERLRSQGFTEARLVAKKSLLWHALIGSSVPDNYSTSSTNEQERAAVQLVDRAVIKLVQFCKKNNALPMVEDIFD